VGVLAFTIPAVRYVCRNGHRSLDGEVTMNTNAKLSIGLFALTYAAAGCSGDNGSTELIGAGGAVVAVGGSSGVSIGGQIAKGGAVAGNVGGGNFGGSTGKADSGALGGNTSVASSVTGGTTSIAVTGGNSSVAGGAPTAGGASAKGGFTGNGTTTTTSGGVTAKGGTNSTGETTSKGGTTNTGGMTASSAGTTASSGGTTAKGGTTSTGGTTGTGGTTSSSNEIWISPTGSDTNPGTKDQPMFTMCDTAGAVGACYKLCPGGTNCKAGTIWVMDGTYKYGSVTQKTGSTFNGTASGMIKVWAEAGAKPVFDFTGMPVASTSRGLQLGGNYWHVKGITVTKAGDTGIFVMGSYITVEQCNSHHNQDAGIVIGVNSSAAGSGQYNTILNCDSYQNNDSATNGENADGFGMKKNAGVGNVFRGCRAWDNSDDGFDLYAWESPVTIDNCWVMSQCKTTKGSASDGNGFKLGGGSVSAKHILSNLYASDNSYGSSGRGFTNNSNPASLTCTGTCASWGNKTGDTGVGGVGTSAPSGATAAKMIVAQRKADGSLPAITSL